ncbi:MAG: ankyrin repeat domain-containing protein, partial [Bryobacterales bacterium]|nr:ankyrin repeat domain-containing protein [Bryobacterales bacterium]
VNGDGGMVMPPTGALSDEEIGILRAWIDQGVDWSIEVREPASPPPPPLHPKAEAFLSSIRTNALDAIRRDLAADPSLAKLADASGTTALHYAAAYGSVEAMELLLANGADARATNRRKTTPLHWAVHDPAKTALLLKHGAPIDAKQVEGRTPLYQAASLGNALPVVRLLLDRGANPNLPMVTGTTPLIAAAIRGKVDIMEALLAKGANVNAAAGTGGTALMAAATSGNPVAVRLLLDKGANAKAVTKRKETALHDAATAGVTESVRLLLAAGADVNAVDLRGYTPLLYAAASDRLPVEVVNILLAKGANPKVIGEGETARQVALKRGLTPVAQLLGATDQDAAPHLATVATKSHVPPTEAVSKALALLEKQSHNFIRIGGCNSCHGQDLPSAAVGFARSRGIAAKPIPQLPPAMTLGSPDRILDLNAIGVGSVAWEMLDLGMNGAKPNAYTDSVAQYIRVMQTPAGNWFAPESRRPPMSAGSFQTTALAIYTLKVYGQPVDQKGAIARAAAWLATAQPYDNQDRAFQLMGLVWAGGDPKAIAAVSKALLATQRPDGSWNQLPAMAADAYAAGQSLYALHLAGLAASHPAYQKGVAWLRQTQSADGSWHVKSRSLWFQPYFESGFPHGHDQWISAAGTAWASLALTAAVEPQVSQLNAGTR